MKSMKQKAPFKGLGYQGRYDDDEEPLKFSWFPLFELVCIVAVVSFIGLVFGR